VGPGVVGGRVLIQITPHMRILVAIESIDGRKYAPSIDMRSPFRQGFKIEALLRRTRPYPHVGLHIT